VGRAAWGVSSPRRFRRLDLLARRGVLSDRTDQSQSIVANGPLKGQTLRQVMEQFRDELMGKLSFALQPLPCCSSFWMRTRCFLFRVHPSDAQRSADSCGGYGKDRSVVVIEAERERISMPAPDTGYNSQTVCVSLSTMEPLSTTLWVSFPSRAMQYSSPRAPVAPLWAMTLWF